MAIKIKRLLLTMAVCGTLSGVQAQLFQKLRDKVNNAVGNKDKSKNQAATNTSASGQSNADNAPVIDFAKYNINVIVAYAPSDIKEKVHNFDAAHSTYKVVNGELVADVAVFATSRQIGEADGPTGSDPAYIFENGKLKATRTVGDVTNDAAVKDAYAHKDWPWSYSGDMTKITGMGANFSYKGKSYSNYFMITTFIIDKNNTHLYGVGAENDSKGDLTYYFFSSGGRRVKLPGPPAGMMYNEDFSSAAVYGMVNRLEGEQQKTGNVLQASANVLNQGDVYFIDGTIKKNANMTANAWLDMSGKNILFADRNAGNYINGNKISDKGSAEGNIWCNADGTKWAYYGGGDGGQTARLVFSDGATIPNAIHPQQWQLNGKTYMAWLQYRGMYNGDMLFCSKEL